MRVAIDATALGSGQGGDEAYVRGLLAGLAAVREEGDSFPLYVRRRAAVPLAIVQNPGFPVYVVPHRSAALRHSWVLPRVLQRRPGGVDLVHSVTWAPLWSPVGRALMVTDLSFRHHPEFYPLRLRLRLNLLVPLQARQARVVMSLSEFGKRDLVSSFGLPPEKVFVVPCAVEFAPGAAGYRRAEQGLGGRGARPPFFLYLGNLHPRKNVPRLIRAFVRARRAAPELAHHQLVIVGGRWWGGGAEECAAREAPVGTVMMLGRLSDPERDRMLREAEALVYPSIFEGFGLPPLEAMAVGTPVLTSNTAAIPEVVGDAALLVDPLDEQAIADGLVRMGRDPGLRASLRERGLRRVGRYSARAVGEQARAAFQWALAAAEPRRDGTLKCGSS